MGGGIAHTHCTDGATPAVLNFYLKEMFITRWVTFRSLCVRSGFLYLNVTDQRRALGSVDP